MALESEIEDIKALVLFLRKQGVRVFDRDNDGTLHVELGPAPPETSQASETGAVRPLPDMLPPGARLIPEGVDPDLFAHEGGI